MTRLLSRRDAVVWTLGFLLVSTLLVVTRFASEDPDSALYAALSARLAEGPPHTWIAPEWWGYWDSEGLFREHPIGVFLLPTLLGALGVPGVQAAYIVGIGAGLAALLLIGRLIAQVTSPADGRLALVLLQLMPIAFIFRIRANHEYPMLVCLLVTLVGLDGVRRSWRWLPVPAAALTAALLIKGVFVVLLFVAAACWIALDPRRIGGAWWRAAAAVGVALVVMAGVALGYDRLYLDVTGETFWGPYWRRQLGPLELATPGSGAAVLVDHLVFYLIRLAWHSAPWGLALVVALWIRGGQTWRQMAPGARRGLVFAVGFTVALIVMLTPASRFAERYVFTANYALGAAGAVTALYVWPGLRRRFEHLDRTIPAFPAACWTALMILRLTVGPLLPRIMG